MRLRDIIASPKGAFAAINGADAVSGYLTQAAQITPRANYRRFRQASAEQRFEDATQYIRATTRICHRWKSAWDKSKRLSWSLRAKNDPIVPPANNQLLADRLPRNRLSLLEAAHRVWEEATENYSSQLMSWFGGEYRVA